MQQPQTSWIVIASLLRPQGRRGELLADLLTDFPGRFEPGSRVYLAAPNFVGTPSDALPQTVFSSWLPLGRNQGRIVIAFEGVDAIEKAERLAGLEVLIPETDRVPLTDGSLYVDTLIGCTVYDRETPVGVVRDVQFMTSSDGKRRLEDAAALLVIDHPTGELLIPFANDLLISVDIDQRSIRMDLPEGLLDLNLAPSSTNQKRSATPTDTTG